MAKPRQLESGRWGISLHHPDLPKGRKFFTFDSEAEALAYEAQWAVMRAAELKLPTELAEPTEMRDVRLARVLGEWERSGYAAKTQELTLRTVSKEVGGTKLSEVNYKWLNDYLRMLKVEKNLSPVSIKHRIQALGRALDEYARNNPGMDIKNPVKLLPRGYSVYNDVDTKMVKAKGKEAKVTRPRDRRLMPGEEEKIIQVLSGHRRPDKARALELRGGDALLVLFLLIVNTGLRLSEAFMLRRSQIDMGRKIINVRSSKQWRGKEHWRDVPMRREVYELLERYMADKMFFPNGYFFPFMEEDGGISQRICSSRLSSRFTTAFEYMGLEDLTEHDLRHEATCRWLELKDANGRDLFRLEELNKIMGWTPGSVMAQRYASFRAEDLASKLWATAAPTPGPAKRAALKSVA